MPDGQAAISWSHCFTCGGTGMVAAAGGVDACEMCAHVAEVEFRIKHGGRVPGKFSHAERKMLKISKE